MKPSAPVSHTVLLYKMDLENFYMKNTNPTEPEIVIPKNRATFYQNYILENGDAFTPKRTLYEILKLFQNIIPKITQPLADEWYFIDNAYLLKLTKKGDENIATDEIDQAVADLEKLLNDAQKSLLKNLTTKVQKHNDVNKKEIEKQKTEIENQKTEIENQKNEIEKQKKEVVDKDKEIARHKKEIEAKDKELGSNNKDLDEPRAKILRLTK